MSSPETPEQTNEYLWSGSGRPDPEVAHLERLLSVYRQDVPLPLLPVLERGWWETLLWSRAIRATAFAAAAAVLLVMVAPWAMRRIALPGEAWQARKISGAPSINGRTMQDEGALRAGGILETDGASQAEIRIGLIGRMTVLPGSRLRLTETRPGRYRMALDHGKIFARTLAPPFTFVVDTPGPTAYDVGCAFALETDESGSGVLSVTSGWVQLELGYHEVLIPGGAASLLRPGGNLGTPFFASASAPFRAALERLDFAPQDTAERAATLRELLDAARPGDVFSLQELLRTATGEERRRIVDRGMELLPPAPGITRADLLRGDDAMMDQWRHQLGLPQVKRWWIHWRDILPE